MKIISVVGARPNFMKMAPVHKAFQKIENESGIEHLICHTGQHYDEKMSKVFFEELELPQPHFHLGAGSGLPAGQAGSHAEQTAKIMVEFEKVLLKEKPDMIIVYGDVNSTIACALTAKKLHIKVAHVEAGLRSFDEKMPEEINRVLTDRISDYLFVSEPSGLKNLKDEGTAEEKIFFAGNTMIDSLINYLPKAEESKIHSELNIVPGDYILVTLHRPSNVDEKKNLVEIFAMLNRLSERRKIIFPVHPRTKNNIAGLDIEVGSNLILTDPLNYIDFLSLIQKAELIVTDSGGIQEEATFLGVQCITMRDNTERPVTVDEGTNQLIGTDIKKIEDAAIEVLNGKLKKGNIPELWDGRTAERIAEAICRKSGVLLEEKV
jgi:UDP-N-acetylglucosamine 2-epimerase (non-hydrolysing)